MAIHSLKYDSLERDSSQQDRERPLVFPGKAWIAALTVLILLQFFSHLGERSPYLYYTEGLFDLEGGVYGMRLGPHGELIHFDAVNYWAVENLFAGKFRGDHLSTIARPLYPFLASLLDNYVDRVHAGWILNLIFWMLAALFGHALAFKVSGNETVALTFSFLVASSPGFVNVCGQPMGYALGYGLFVIFMGCVAQTQIYFRAPAAYIWTLIFLLAACDLTYQVLGPFCAIFLVLYGFRTIKTAHLILIVSGALAIKLGWSFLVTGPLLEGASKPLPGPNPASVLAKLSDISWIEVGRVPLELAYGAFLSTFFLPAALAAIFFVRLPSEAKRFCLIALVSVMVPLGAMGLVGAATGHYVFYQSGRLVAYFFPAIYLAASQGLVGFCASHGFAPKVARLSAWALVLSALILANLDAAGFQVLYHAFNRRPGFW